MPTPQNVTASPMVVLDVAIETKLSGCSARSRRGSSMRLQSDDDAPRAKRTQQKLQNAYLPSCTSRMRFCCALRGAWGKFLFRRYRRAEPGGNSDAGLIQHRNIARCFAAYREARLHARGIQRNARHYVGFHHYPHGIFISDSIESIFEVVLFPNSAPRRETRR